MDIGDLSVLEKSLSKLKIYFANMKKKVYSHSKLSTFEQCKYKYKLRYIDKIPSPVEKSIEAHLGTCVHEALEWLYKEILKGNLPSIDEVLEKYANQWKSEYKSNFLIVKKEFTSQDYFEKGIKFLTNYYIKHKPFNDGTLELEKKIWINLTDKHSIVGYIDRLVYNKEKGRYEIHDYKTANFLPPQKKFDTDRQLALYSIAIKEIYGENTPIILTWHYLNHNKQIFSKRTKEELNQLKFDTLKLIQEIENTKEFPPKKSPLCDWCEYKKYCKAWGNTIPEKYKTKQETLNKEKIKEQFPTLSKYIKD